MIRSSDVSENQGETTSFERLTDISGVVGRTKDELRCSVVPRADVADIWLPRYQYLRRTEIAKLEYTCCGVKQQVLRLDISMTNPNRVDVHKRTEKLIHVKLDLEHRHGLLQLCIVTTCTIDGLWDVFKDKVEVDFIFLL